MKPCPYIGFLFIVIGAGMLHPGLAFLAIGAGLWLGWADKDSTSVNRDPRTANRDPLNSPHEPR